ANAWNKTVPVDQCPADAMILDAGPETVKSVVATIKASKTLVWNGPLGAFEITTIFDGAAVFDGPYPIIGANASAEEVQALAAANGLPETKLEIPFTPTVVNTGSELILFDAGNGEARRPGRGNLLAGLAAAGYTPDQIDVVVITHMHPDHIGGLMEGGAPAFPNATYMTGAAEYDFWTPEAMLDGPAAGVAKLVQSNVVPLAEKTKMLQPGDAVASGVEAVNAFGHTPGHMAYHIESEGERLLLISDAANHFILSLQRPDWHFGFDADKDAAVATRKKLLGMIAADGIVFTGYHMPFPAIGRLTAAGDGFLYQPETYQLSITG
ncbi:MAG: phosphoglycerate kinase, partial [Pseudomonadota bacterium]